MEKVFLFLLICIALAQSCEYESIEEKFYSQNVPDTTSAPVPTDTVNPGDTLNPVDTVPTGFVQPTGELAWYTFNGSLKDSTANNTPLILVGNTSFVDGLNSDYGKGLYLDGSTYLLINLGYYDTLSLFFWIKGDGGLSTFDEPVLFDYGLNAVSTSLDATSGATQMNVQKKGNVASSEEANIEYLNSFNRYSFFYFEAGGATTEVYFKGYSSNGEEIIYHQELTLSGGIQPSSELLYIGRSSQRDIMMQSLFRGAIDELHIYDHPLSTTEIESLAFTYTE